jgi:deoxyhypusine synthase
MNRELHDGRHDGLMPLESLNLSKVEHFSDLIKAMKKTAFGGRTVGEAFEVLLEMFRDDDCAVILTLSGAMTVAKQGMIICELIDRGIIQAVISTGALIAHGVTESIGLTHYAVNPNIDDKELFEKGYNRVYDTLEMEANLNDVCEVVGRVLDLVEPENGVWCSHRFCYAVGKELETLNYGPGILRSAYSKNVPVYIPAFTDSEIGLDFSTWTMKKTIQQSQKQDNQWDSEELFQAIPNYNPFLDLQHYARLIGRAKRLGILTIGGGVPRNWAQQVGPYYDITEVRLNVNINKHPRFQYGVRICPEPAHWGGLSGCTYSEGVSWGKFVPIEEGGKYAEVLADATIVLPLLIKGVFEELDSDK